MSTKIFIRASVFLALVSVIIITITFFVNYNLAVKARNAKVRNNSEKIYASILENFDYTEKLLSFMGSEILKHDRLGDLEFIHKLFVMVSQMENQNNNLFSWSRFDWVDKDNKQTVNTMTGIEKNYPYDMSVRDYTRDARLDPWKLKFVRPLVGYPSHLYVIPIGVGVFSKEKGYAGLIAVGIDIKKLISKISATTSEGNEFALVGNSGYDFILGSSFDFLRNDKGSQELLLKIRRNLVADEEGFIGNEIVSGDVQYIYSLPMGKDYPYTIITGYDEKKFWRSFYMHLTPIIIQIIAMAIFTEMILVVLWIKNKP